MITNQYKIVLLGDGAVGKSSLRRNYMGEPFKKDYNMTLGSDFAVKRISLGKSQVNLVIWDLAGQPRFSAVRSLYYRGARGALLVFDLTRPDTYESLSGWVAELLRNNKKEKVPMVLIGNKSDLRGSLYHTISEDYGQDYAARLAEWSGYEIPYIETSAKYGDNVEKSFSSLVNQILEGSKKTIIESYLEDKL